MAKNDRTDMGGVRGTFLTTHWSLIENVKLGEDKDRALIGLLLNRYWKPVYCCLRRKGYNNEQAKDMTQGFFHEVVLNRNLIERADQSKGRFRSFLLHALNQYVVDEQRKDAAKSRIPKDKLIRIDMAEPPILSQAAHELDAEQCFNYAWKLDLLERVLSELRDRYTEQGMESHWHVFRDRLLEPSLEDSEVPSLGELCVRYGIENETKASNMLTTIKRQFQSVLKKHIRQTVISGDATEDELKEIFRFFNKQSRD